MLGLQLMMLAGSIQGCQGWFCAPYCRQLGFGRGVGIGGFFQNGIVNGHTAKIRRPPFVGGVADYYADLNGLRGPRKDLHSSR